jgi:hypothetical protein
MKKLLVAIFCLTLFMVAHATVKEVAVEYLTKVNGITRIPNNVGNVAFYWHIHPNCNIQADNSFGSSKPSNADIKYQRDMQQSGYKGNAFVIGLNKSQVTFYNKNGEIITLPYSVFKDLGEK